MCGTSTAMRQANNPRPSGIATLDTTSTVPFNACHTFGEREGCGSYAPPCDHIPLLRNPPNNPRDPVQSISRFYPSELPGSGFFHNARPTKFFHTNIQTYAPSIEFAMP